MSERKTLGKLVTRFSVYNTPTTIDSAFEGTFIERIAPGAFRKSIAENAPRIRALYAHGRDPQIGGKILGRIDRFRDEDDGAYAEIALYDTSFNRDLVDGLRDGQYGASFSFKPIRVDVEEWPQATSDNPHRLPVHTVREAALREVGPCPFGAYPDAGNEVRSAAEPAAPSSPELGAERRFPTRQAYLEWIEGKLAA